ncbi:hypothetical protein Ccrd_017031, partial [Cynara cardunculus var. scolymus]
MAPDKQIIQLVTAGSSDREKDPLSIDHVEQIENLQRPISMEAGSIVLMDLLSDPTENDSVEGLRPNARGPGLVTFVEISSDSSQNVRSALASVIMGMAQVLEK